MITQRRSYYSRTRFISEVEKVCSTAQVPSRLMVQVKDDDVYTK